MSGVRKDQGSVEVGKVRLHFYVLPNGTITEMKVVSNTSNRAFLNVCVDAVRRKKFPPPPVELLKEQRLEVNFDFALY